jgi:hypothetical protein
VRARAHEMDDQSRNVACNQQHAFLRCPSHPQGTGEAGPIGTGHPQGVPCVRWPNLPPGTTHNPNFVSTPPQPGSRDRPEGSPWERDRNEAGMCPEINRLAASPLYQGFGRQRGRQRYAAGSRNPRFGIQASESEPGSENPDSRDYQDPARKRGVRGQWKGEQTQGTQRAC